jgi:hypothetical protein
MVMQDALFDGEEDLTRIREGEKMKSTKKNHRQA